MIHHGFKQGKKILIILHTGEHIVDKFRKSTSNYIELENQKIRWRDIRSSTIYKDRKMIEAKPLSVSKIKCVMKEKI